MDNTIDLTKPVAQVLNEHPELLRLLVDLGFKPLENPRMLNTAGKIISIQQGAKLIQVPIEYIIQELEWNGYQVKGANNHDNESRKD